MQIRAVTKLQHTEFVFVDEIAVFHPVGRQSLQQAVGLVRDAITRACIQRINKLLVVLTDVTGYEAPSLAMRLSIVRERAGAAGGTVSLAVVCRPEFIDPQKFGVTVAANFGMVGNVFESEYEAIQWLHDLD